jgi:hypothetical protein
VWARIEYIDRYVAKKMLALAEHRSQVATIPYGEGVLGLNRRRAVFADPKAGAPAGAYAEVFRQVPISPPFRQSAFHLPFLYILRLSASLQSDMTMVLVREASRHDIRLT